MFTRAPRFVAFVDRTVALWTAVAVAFVLTVWGAYSWGKSNAISTQRRSAEHRLELYIAALSSELSRYDYLPTVLALNSDLISLLRQPLDPALVSSTNRFLQDVNIGAGATTIYVLDRQGVVLASSNWNEIISFVGMSLAYRPYFQDALQGKSGRFYGIGTTSGEPGYFFSRGIYLDGSLLGVAAAKISLDKIETAWSDAGEKVIVSDPDGVILLASDREWKFRTLRALSSETLARITETRQYHGADLTPIGLTAEANLAPGSLVMRLTVPAAGTNGSSKNRLFLATDRAMKETGWHVTVLWDLAPALTFARNSASIAALALACVVLLLLYLNQRLQANARERVAKVALQRAHDELERKVAKRTSDLQAANQRLQVEIDVRGRAESDLRDAQDGLVHASKMAVLGQLSAGIAHELNQPLTALRTLSDNAIVLLERDRLDSVRKNLTKVSQIVDRMGKITGQLKSFARKAPSKLGTVVVQRAVGSALSLLEARLQKAEVEIGQDMPADDVLAIGDSDRLEQVLVNLFGNAIDAMEQAAVRQLEIWVRYRNSTAIIRVRDSGSGISSEMLPRLFEPFSTTKTAGAGLGLGLAISSDIIKAFGGSLRGGNRPEGGAEFLLELRSATAEAAA